MEKYEYARTITFDMVKNMFPKRAPESHKGTLGKLLCVCGSKNMPGAACFSVAAAVKSGVGLVQAVVTDSVYNAVSQKISEVVFSIAPQDENGFMTANSAEIILKESKKCTAVLVGCGMGRNQSTKEIVFKLIQKSNVPVIIDADGINVLSENINILKDAKAPIIITPHVKEMSRLTKKDIETILTNKIEEAKEFSKKYKVTVVLKGNNTVVCGKEGDAYVNPTGNAGMAKGGSGDVLAGIIASFSAQGFSALNAATCGVYIHGLSGDICSRKFSEICMTPTDLINELHSVFIKFENQR